MHSGIQSVKSEPGNGCNLEKTLERGGNENLWMYPDMSFSLYQNLLVVATSSIRKIPLC